MSEDELKKLFWQNCFTVCPSCNGSVLLEKKRVDGCRYNGDAYGAILFSCVPSVPNQCTWSSVFRYDDASEVYYYETIGWTRPRQKVERAPVATVNPYDDSKMNLVFSSTWALSDLPSVQTVRVNPYMNPAEYPRMELATHVNAFVLKVPVPLDSNEFVEIPFAGGTLQELLGQIHRFYQEPVSLDDVALLETRGTAPSWLIQCGRRHDMFVC